MDEEDWGLQACAAEKLPDPPKDEDEIWLNTCGTCGIASATAGRNIQTHTGMQTRLGADVAFAKGQDRVGNLHIILPRANKVGQVIKRYGPAYRSNSKLRVLGALSSPPRPFLLQHL